MSVAAEAPHRPVRVAIHDDCDLVTSGLGAMLALDPGRARLVDSPLGLASTSSVDVVLADACSRLAWIPRSGPALVAYSWRERPEDVARALSAGAAGFITKAAGCAVLLEALESVVAGEQVILLSDGSRDTLRPGSTAPVDRSTRLSPRESEVGALLTQGLTNQEIADRLAVSINSVKTYVRALYRKVGLTSRSQAVRWGIENGFDRQAASAVGTSS